MTTPITRVPSRTVNSSSIPSTPNRFSSQRTFVSQRQRCREKLASSNSSRSGPELSFGSPNIASLVYRTSTKPSSLLASPKGVLDRKARVQANLSRNEHAIERYVQYKNEYVLYVGLLAKKAGAVGPSACHCSGVWMRLASIWLPAKISVPTIPSLPTVARSPFPRGSISFDENYYVPSLAPRPSRQRV